MTDNLPALIGMKDVKRLTGVSEHATINKMVANKQFPKPMKRKNPNEPLRWKKSLVLAWLNEGSEGGINISKEDLNKLIDQRIIEMLRSSPAALQA